MHKIVIASKNPVKERAALQAFKRMFPDQQFKIQGVSVESGVSDQPLDDAETYTGAHNRAVNAKQEMPDADYWVGIEGGVETKEHGMEAFAWVVVCSRNGRIGKGKTAVFFLPPKVAELINQGKELGEADDIVFGRTNSKQANGAIGLLTDDVVDRTAYYIEATIFALIPFKNQELYPA